MIPVFRNNTPKTPAIEEGLRLAWMREVNPEAADEKSGPWDRNNHIRKRNEELAAARDARREVVLRLFRRGAKLEDIADETGVSVCTAKKDIAALRAAGRLLSREDELREVYRRIIAMHDAGHPQGVIADRTGKSRRTVQRVIGDRWIAEAR